MTPAIEELKQQNIRHEVHDYAHDPRASSYGEEAADALDIPPSRVFKTLVVNAGDRLVVGIVPVSGNLDLKRLARSAGAKKARMAEPKEVERTTGYVLGGVSPVGQKRPLQTIIDESAERHATIFVSAGRRGLEIELAPADLRAATGGEFAPISS
jgi:Cys-tRNA(Pro)/Cys-tRNA(Cys) deacylase